MFTILMLLTIVLVLILVVALQAITALRKWLTEDRCVKIYCETHLLTPRDDM